MANRLRIREVSAFEAEELRRLASSRKEPAMLVQRAQVIVAMQDDPRLSAASAGRRAGYARAESGALWVRRFNERGIEGLHDKPRSGRPRRHSEQTRGELIALARQRPQSLGCPFALWTLERLQRAFKEQTGTHLSDSTIWTWLRDEGLVWKRQQSWFVEPERHDPQFAEKRGPLSVPIGTSARIRG